MKKNTLGRFFPFILAFVLFLMVLAGCSTNSEPDLFKETTDEIKYEADNEYLSFEEAVQRSTDIVMATFEGYHKYEHYNELEFSISKILKGETEEPTIYVFEVITSVSTTGEKDVSYTTGQYNFIPGHDYLLVLERDISVYYDHDRYTMLGEIFLPIDEDTGFYMYNEPIENHSNQLDAKIKTTGSLVDLVGDLSKSAKNDVSFYGTEYSTSEDLSEISAQSDYIVQVTIDEQIIDGVLNDTQTFSSSIKELLKGEFSAEEIEEWEDTIYVVFNKGEVVPGEEYILLLNRTDPQSRLFIHSSKNSVHQITNDQDVEWIYNELGF